MSSFEQSKSILKQWENAEPLAEVYDEVKHLSPFFDHWVRVCEVGYDDDYNEVEYTAYVRIDRDRGFYEFLTNSWKDNCRITLDRKLLLINMGVWIIDLNSNNIRLDSDELDSDDICYHIDKVLTDDEAEDHEQLINAEPLKEVYDEVKHLSPFFDHWVAVRKYGSKCCYVRIDRDKGFYNPLRQGHWEYPLYITPNRKQIYVNYKYGQSTWTIDLNTNQVKFNSKDPVILNFDRVLTDEEYEAVTHPRPAVSKPLTYARPWYKTWWVVGVGAFLVYQIIRLIFG